MLEFRNPPTTRNTATFDWKRIEKMLTERPNEWLQIGEQINVSTANAIRDGKIKLLLPINGFEIVTRNNDTSKSPRVADHFVRYVPANDIRLHPRRNKEKN